MAAMAAGDRAALFPFIDEFGNRLAGMVRAVLRSLHRIDVARSEHDFVYLLQSAALVIFDRSKAWDPTGALPWTWAERAIRAEVVNWLGHPSLELIDNDLGLQNDAGCAVQADVDFDRLAIEHPLVRLLVEAVRTVASPRDVEVHFQFQAQKSMGDPSPAHTVADMCDLSPANVRQINARVRRRLSELAASNPTFTALSTVAWVEVCRRRTSSIHLSPRPVRHATRVDYKLCRKHLELSRTTATRPM